MFPAFPTHRRHAVARAAIALGLALQIHCAAAQPRDFDIRTQPLAPALAALAAQAGLQLAFAPELAAGRQAPAVRGTREVADALHALLAGSGLQGRVQGRTLVVERVAQAVRTLGEVTVSAEAERETAAGPVHGYVAKRSATATKTDTPLSETPQSVSVIPREQMEAQAADSLDQALQYTAGVSLFEGGGTRNAGTRIVVRGFNTSGTAVLYLNGSKFPMNSLSGSIEPYNFERIELLKGPASVLYGQATPGGVINLVSKRPTATAVREIELQAGSWNRKQIAFDLGGPVSEDGRIRYRLTGLQRDSDNMIRQNANDRTSLSGALDWQLTGSTLLTLLGTYDQTRAAFDPGKPQDGTLLPNPAGKISRDLFIGETGNNQHRIDGRTLGYLLEHRFNDTWQFRQNLLAYDNDVDSNYVSLYSRVTAATPRLGNRYAVSRIDSDKGVSLDNQLHGALKLGRFEHHVLVGLDGSKSDFKRNQRIGAVTPIDLFSPVYGAQPVYGAGNDSDDRYKQLGLYVQDQIKLDGRWIGLIGGRYDQARGDGGAGTREEKSHAFTPRLGLMYLFGNGVSPYYSYSRAFQPNTGTDFHLNRFKPTTGTQHEIGVKYEPNSMNASVTVAAYEITQRNVQTSDPDHPGYAIQTGEQRSRGFEIEGRAEVTRQLDLIAALAVTNARITKSNTGTEGAHPASVPRNMASLWADYRLDAVPNMSIGWGMRRTGEQEVGRIAVPAYTVYDAALRYQRDKWQFALNIKNLADKTYFAACPSLCYYGDERNVVLTARYKW